MSGIFWHGLDHRLGIAAMACPWRASLIGNINDMLDDCGLAL
jgi:hypothetical protein